MPKPEMKYKVGDMVRVVNPLSNWFAWEGEVTALFNGELLLGVKHYQIMFIVNKMIRFPPLLFTESELLPAPGKETDPRRDKWLNK